MIRVLITAVLYFLLGCLMLDSFIRWHRGELHSEPGYFISMLVLVIWPLIALYIFSCVVVELIRKDVEGDD